MPKKIKLTGVVGWEMNPEDISDQLEKANGEDLDVYIASPGGSVIDGIEIFNMFRDYKRNHPDAQISAEIKGMAASMATYLALNPAFDLLSAEDNAVFMIHNPYGCTCGDHNEMSKFSEILKGLTNLIADVYAKKTKKPKGEVLKMMDDETWLFGEEILKAGFVDEIIKTDEEKNEGQALAVAKTKFQEAMKKVESKKQDTEKIAAMIKPIEKIKIDLQANSLGKEVGNKLIIAQTPVENAGKNNNLEVPKMELQEFLNTNPTAKDEYNKNLEAGVAKVKEEIKSTIKIATKYLGKDENDKAYPGAIQKIAIDVLNGKKTAEALETTVSAFDAFVETQNSNAAEGEQPEDTAGEQGAQPTEGGEIKTEADFQAEVKRTKSEYGLEV